MRRPLLALATAVLLLGPTALAFRSGGYFDGPRLVSALVVWAIVLVVALRAADPVPRTAPGRLALAGIVLLTGWTAASLAWAPLDQPATDSLLRLVLYVGALIAAMALLRERAAARAVEPLLALGALVVIGYGLAGRLVPGVVHLERSFVGGGRLEQPITYWNAEGALAAMGFVLATRLAGDRTRPVAVRALAAAGCAPLAVGTYLTFSRGALAAAVVGVVVLLAAAPTRAQVRAAVTALLTGTAAAAAAGALPGVASLQGTPAQRAAEGGLAGAALVGAMLAAWAWTRRVARQEADGRRPTGEVSWARALRGAAVGLIVVVLAGLVIGGLGERGATTASSSRADAARLTSVNSRRYDYWRIGLSNVPHHPLEGTGAGGFRVLWLRERPVADGALEVHSLELEMLVELGLVGFGCLALFLGATGVAARRALRRRPGLAAGPIAAGTVFLLHATIDWDWQIPAVTLPALILAGALVAASEAEDDHAAPAAVASVDATARPRSATPPVPV